MFFERISIWLINFLVGSLINVGTGSPDGRHDSFETRLVSKDRIAYDRDGRSLESRAEMKNFPIFSSSMIKIPMSRGQE